jgi:hypothetical protein
MRIPLFTVAPVLASQIAIEPGTKCHMTTRWPPWKVAWERKPGPSPLRQGKSLWACSNSIVGENRLWRHDMWGRSREVAEKVGEPSSFHDPLSAAIQAT